MKTIHEISKITNLTIRTLQYYDSIGLLKAIRNEENGYRLYDEEQLETLQMILLLRELEFPLADIKEIIQSKNFNKQKAIEDQIKILKCKRKHIDDLIQLAESINKGEKKMSFKEFDKTELEQLEEEAKKKWKETKEYQEYESRKQNKKNSQNTDMMDIFKRFGLIRENLPESKESQELVKVLQEFITKHYYTCSREMLMNLGEMYVSDERFMKNIDEAGGNGTAVFVREAIKAYTK